MSISANSTLLVEFILNKIYKLYQEPGENPDIFSSTEMYKGHVLKRVLFVFKYFHCEMARTGTKTIC